MSKTEQIGGELDSGSRELVVNLRKANSLASALKYPEAVWTISEAIGAVLNPAGFASAEDRLSFSRQENALAGLNRTAHPENGERFLKVLDKARDMAGSLGDPAVMALIDAAAGFHIPANSFSRNLSSGIFNSVARDDRHDPSTTVTGIAFNLASRDSRGMPAAMAPRVSAGAMTI